MTPALELRRASIGYGDRAVVHDVDLEVAPGEVVALLGPNGSGKTTLVRGVLGLAGLLHGDIELFGTPLASLTERGRLGYVPQRNTVAGAVPSTVRELASSGRLSRRPLLRRASARDRTAVDEAIAAVDLTERGRTDVSQLSGGQQRRVLIARALASEPELLLMDEPTAGVDRASQEALVRTLRRLVEQGLTVVVVTHEVGPLVPLLDRVVVMDDGRVAYDGPWQPAVRGPGQSPGPDGGPRGAHGGHGVHGDEVRAPSWASALGAPVRDR